MKSSKHFIFLMVFVLALSGCGTIQKAKRSDALEAEVSALYKQIEELKNTKDTQLSDLEMAKRELEDRLSQELLEYKAKLKMTEEGLVVTFLAEIFFDSGKAKLRTQAQPSLRKVSAVLNSNVIDYLIEVQGHTDNAPIKHSPWKSNWELASGRALSVVHFFIEECEVDPLRLSAASFSEYKPVDTNDTTKGKQNNRRVEIVIKKKHKN